MAITNQSYGTVDLDNSGGTPVDISAWVRDVTLNEAKNVGQFWTLDNIWAKQSEGGRSWTADMTIVESQSATEGHGYFRDWASGQRTLTLESPDGSVGSLRFTGEVVRGGVNPLHANSAGGGEPISPRVSLMGYGALTVSIIT